MTHSTRNTEAARVTRACILLVASVLLLGAAGCTDPQTTPPPTGTTSKNPAPRVSQDRHSVTEQEIWSSLYNGRTMRQWYAIAKDTQQDKFSRQEAFQELARAGRPGAYTLFQLAQAPDEASDGRFGHATQPSFVRQNAIAALGSMGAVAKPTAEYLAILVRTDKDVAVRIQAATALGKLRASDERSIRALKDVLRSNDYAVWSAAVTALGLLQARDDETIHIVTQLSDLNVNTIPNSASYKGDIVGAKIAAGDVLTYWRYR